MLFDLIFDLNPDQMYKFVRKGTYKSAFYFQLVCNCLSKLALIDSQRIIDVLGTDLEEPNCGILLHNKK